MPFRWMPAQGNLLALCRDTPDITVTALDALTPYTQAFDGRPSTPIRYAARGALPFVRGVMNFLANSGFETVDLADWIVGAGTSVRTTTGGEVHAGTASLKFTSAANRYQDVTVPAGIPFTLLAALRGDGANASYVQVLNLDTGLYLNSAGAWVADTTVRALSRITNTYAAVTLAATAEPYSATGRYLTRLRVIVGGAATGTFCDDVKLRPSWNFVGMFGHNLTGRGEYQSPGTAIEYFGQVPRWDIDSAQFGWIVPGGGLMTDGSTYAIPRPNTWQTWTTPQSGHEVNLVVLSDQYANYPIVSFGELVIGYVEDLAPAGFPIVARVAEPGQVRNETPGGDVYTYNSGPNPLREVTLRFTYDSDAREQQLRERLYLVSRGGADGIILVPPTDILGATVPPSQLGCIFGLPDAEFSFSIEGPSPAGLIRSASLVVRELPSPEVAG